MGGIVMQKAVQFQSFFLTVLQFAVQLSHYESAWHGKTGASCFGSVEGSSINSIVRMSGVAKHTILKLLEDMGCACAAYHHRHVRGLRARRIQCDEIWQFVGAKAKNATAEQKAAGWGDAWTWVALDAESTKSTAVQRNL